MWAQQRKQVGLKSKASSLRKGTINGTPEVPFMAVGKETAGRAVTEVALAQKAEFSCWKTRFWGRRHRFLECSTGAASV